MKKEAIIKNWILLDESKYGYLSNKEVKSFLFKEWFYGWIKVSVINC